MNPTLVLALRIVGLSHLVLGLAHIVLWRALRWGKECERLTPLTARVFFVHTFFIAFVLMALGAVALLRPDLLVVRSELARLVLGAAVAFWLLRLLAQPLIFDPVLLIGSPYRTPVRVAAVLGLSVTTAVYAWAFAAQFAAEN